MGLATSCSYIAVFSAGTMLGASISYLYIKYKNYLPASKVLDSVLETKMLEHWQPGQEERYEFKDPADEYRLIMAVRGDLKMQKGKVAAQCAHAAMAAYAKALQRPELLKNWLTFGGTKIAVRIDSEEEMMSLNKKAKQLHILSSIIKDAGQTQVSPGTRTVIAIGPAPKSVLDQITGHLKLY